MSEMDLHEDVAPTGAAGGAGPALPPDGERADVEAPPTDTVEQRTDLLDTADGSPVPVPDEVDPADRAEQQRVVDLDEDDYR